MTASQGRSPTGYRKGRGRRLRPRTSWKKKSAALLAALTIGSPILAACGNDEGGAAVLRFMGPADGVDQYTAAAQKCSEQADGRYTIEYDVSAK